MSEPRRLPGTIAEIQGSPHDATIGAFFDLDGTLISGMSARELSRQQMRDGQFAPGEMLKTIGVIAGSGGINRETIADMLDVAAQGWLGRPEEDLEEMGLRLFRKRLADMIYPEMRDIVRAHQEQGHTVALTSSAASFQTEPIAAYLGIEHVICNRFAAKDGILTGEVVRPVIWGPGKSDAVQEFAAEHGLDMARSYFYADGDEDVALMHLVGEPRPTNPGGQLEKVAKQRGWPVVKLASRGQGSLLRSVAGFASLVPVATVGAAVGLLKRDKRVATNTVSRFWPDLIFRINNVKLNIMGEDNAWVQRPAVFIFNHRNGFDPFIVSKIINRDFTGVAKGELRKDPIVGTFGRLIDVAFVDRGNTTKAIESLKAIDELVEKGLSVIVAPEGTRLDTTEVGEFKKGAFRIAMAGGIPLVPIIIRNAEMIGGTGATTMNPGTVDVAVLPPIPTASWELDDLEDNIAEVRQLFLDTLADWPDDVPVVTSVPPTDTN